LKRDGCISARDCFWNAALAFCFLFAPTPPGWKKVGLSENVDAAGRKKKRSKGGTTKAKKWEFMQGNF
jgi:hypothetical protein